MLEETKHVAKTKIIQIWNLEHPLVYTTGLKFQESHLRIKNKKSIPIQPVKRGGSIVIHNPGQLVQYLIVPVSFLEFGLETFVRQIESAIIQTLLEFGVISFLVPPHSGVFTSKGKIAYVGLGVKNGCTYHGLAVNIYNSLEPYSYINSCGLEYKTTRLINESKFLDNNHSIFLQFQEKLNFHISSIFSKKIHASNFRKWIFHFQNKNPSVSCAFLLGQSYFNARRYWYAHEAWECYWRYCSKGHYKLFLQGLIQLSSAMYKIYDKINIKGAISLLQKAYKNLHNNIYIKQYIVLYNSTSILEYINTLLQQLEKNKNVAASYSKIKRKKKFPIFLILSPFYHVSKINK